MIRRLYEWLDDRLHPKREWTWRRLREAKLDALEHKDEYRLILGNGTLYITGMEVIGGQPALDLKRRAVRVITDKQRKIRATKDPKPS